MAETNTTHAEEDEKIRSDIRVVVRFQTGDMEIFVNCFIHPSLSSPMGNGGEDARLHSARPAAALRQKEMCGLKPENVDGACTEAPHGHRLV